LAFAFAPQLKSAVEALFKKKEEEEEKVIAPERLEEWVNENISRIRQLYVSAKFLIKFQRVPEEIIQRFRELGLDPSVVDREKYFRETLPPLFLDWLGQIMVQCDKSLWQRSQVLISAMVQASQAQMMMRGAG
jgi:phosphotransacetylase